MGQISNKLDYVVLCNDCTPNCEVFTAATSHGPCFRCGANPSPWFGNRLSMALNKVPVYALIECALKVKK